MDFKKNILAVLLVLFSGSGAFVLAAEAANKEPILTTINSAESLRMINANRKNKNFILLDVRTPEEFKEKHIKEAVNINFHGEDFSAKLNMLPKSRKILIYCRSGNRSGKSLPIMKGLGFKEVYNMDGGLNDWEANGFPLERP